MKKTLRLFKIPYQRHRNRNMGKDPAFLFYSADFMMGSMLLSMEERGQYITLLAVMHQQGRMTESEIVEVLKVAPSEKLRAKFKVDENGKWYNNRLETEAEKRKAFSESRRQNRQKKKTSSTSVLTSDSTSVPLVENENVNEDINGLGKGGGMGEPLGYKPTASDFGELPQPLLKANQMLYQVTKRASIPEQVVRSFWEGWKATELTGNKWYSDESDVYKHFRNRLLQTNFNGNSTAPSANLIEPGERDYGKL